LRLIAGLSGYSRGKIDWPTMMYDADGQPEREISFVFQEPQLMNWANIFDNVALPLTLKGVDKSEIRERVMAMLDMVSLGSFADAYPRQLSGGMKMRASIARALVTRPRMLLMDEPFAALDEITRHRLSNDLLEIWSKSDSTVLFVTHSVFESVYLSTRVVVMAPRPGRVVEELSIDAPYPRDTGFRHTPQYASICKEVSASLAKATLS
jgi:NitT/TauT family transport system ATP-binding protein